MLLWRLLLPRPAVCFGHTSGQVMCQLEHAATWILTWSDECQSHVIRPAARLISLVFLVLQRTHSCTLQLTLVAVLLTRQGTLSTASPWQDGKLSYHWVASQRHGHAQYAGAEHLLHPADSACGGWRTHQFLVQC